MLPSTISIRSLDFQARVTESSSRSIIRSSTYLHETEELKILLQNQYFDFRVLTVAADDRIELAIGNLICPKCHRNVPNLEHGLCHKCITPDDPFRIRLECLFQTPSSYLVQYGTCDKTSPPCGISKNTKYCHSSHILYIGMIGAGMKVGISRVRRKGGFEQRLYEQGLTEAVVIQEFDSRIDALKEEQWWLDLGYKSRLHFDEKVQQVRQDIPPSLSTILSETMLKEKYPDKEITYYNLNDPLYLPESTKKSMPISGTISHIRGPILVCDNRSIYDVRQLGNRLVRKFDINGERII